MHDGNDYCFSKCSISANITCFEISLHGGIGNENDGWGTMPAGKISVWPGPTGIDYNAESAAKRLVA